MKPCWSKKLFSRRTTPELTLMQSQPQARDFCEDGVRPPAALGALEAARFGDWAHSSSSLTSPDMSLGQPPCEVETDSSLGGQGDLTCSWLEERFTRGLSAWLNKCEKRGGFFALVLYLPGLCACSGRVWLAQGETPRRKSPAWQYRVPETALRLRPRRALSSAPGQNCQRNHNLRKFEIKKK